jgi:general secretion pathway protein A
MYLAHFRLKKEPFGIAPDPGLLWIGNQHARIFETLREAVFDREGCVILTGDIGTGKTALVKRVVHQEGAAAVFITVSGPELSGLDFYHVLAAEFHMNRRFASREQFIDDFTRVLSHAFGTYRKVILIIDEAQRLTREALNDLIVLSDLQANGKRLLKILLVGQLNFNAEETLERHAGALPSIAAHCCLEPLTEEDTRKYIAHRLKAAGREQPLFSADAIKEIHALSKGYPRLINIICDHALLYGYSANLQLIDSGVIRDCSRDLSVALGLEDTPEDRPSAPAAEDAATTIPSQTASPTLGGWRSWLYLAAAVVTAGAAFYLLAR